MGKSDRWHNVGGSISANRKLVLPRGTERPGNFLHTSNVGWFMSSPITPPPPQMYSSPETAVAEPSGPGLSEPQRLVNTFIAPSKTFADIRRNASWWVPLLLISIFSIAFFVTIDKKVGFDQVARTMLENNKAIQQLDPVQQQQAYSRTAIGFKVDE